MQNIFNKISKISSVQKPKLSRKIKLNSLNDLSGSTDEIGTYVDEAWLKFGKASELQSEAKELSRSASDIIRGVAYEIEQVISELNELGLDYTNAPAVMDIISRFNTQVEEYNQMLDEYHYEGDYHQEI